MGAEMVVALGARTALGRLLDAQRALARANHPLALPWVFQPGDQSTRCTLFRSNCALLDWSPIVQHLSRVLHRGVPTAATHTAGSLRRAAACNNSSVFCHISAWRLGAAMDTRGATDCPGDCRLWVGNIPFRVAAFRCSFTVPFPRRSRPVRSDQTHEIGRASC